ncbi:uncharacterized protein C11orf97 homolog isoform X1 [Erinaceus europaeus]|uniref:Uncharacterized protein C11orf97 homolog isoform X1 n=1 Tax=Erinaceus europaeus TaxID=9365 RepID=A0ABM3WGG2_ERIEU|nr:uncharacterized protein C11orf97 homolog isoform X1 [Erinaceus europaeus]
MGAEDGDTEPLAPGARLRGDQGGCPQEARKQWPLLSWTGCSQGTRACPSPRLAPTGALHGPRKQHPSTHYQPLTPGTGPVLAVPAAEQGKKFFYCEPHKRIKEVLEEELYMKRDECHIRSPPAAVLEGIWSIQRNLPMGSLKQGLPSRNSSLPHAKYYSRHGGLRR